MWQRYINKTVLVKELDEERGYGSTPMSFTVLAVRQIELNEMAYVANTSGDVYWICTSRYVVLMDDALSEETATWYPYLGKSLLVTNSSNNVMEVIPIQARGTYCLGKFKWLPNTDGMSFGSNDRGCKWFDTNVYTICNQMLQG